MNGRGMFSSCRFACGWIKDELLKGERDDRKSIEAAELNDGDFLVLRACEVAGSETAVVRLGEEESTTSSIWKLPDDSTKLSLIFDSSDGIV